MENISTTIPKTGYTPNFIAPAGRGRPPQETQIPAGIGSFVDGVDLFNDSLATNGTCYFAINNRCYTGRTLDKRLGYVVKGGTGASGKVLMIGELKKASADNILIRIVTSGTQVDVQKYNPGTDTFSSIGIFGTINSQVNFYCTSNIINGEERLYFCNGVDELRYTEGNTINIVAGVYPKFITSVQNVLVIGNISTTYKRHQVLFAKAGTHQFYKDTDLTYAASSNLVSFDDEVTQVKTLGWLCYVFTASEGLWELDLSTTIPRVVSTHGTLSPKSVACGNDIMIWADQFSFWGLALGGQVQRIGEPIENIYKNVLYANLPEFAAIITPDGYYRCWVGDLTFNGESFTNVNFVYEVERTRVTNKKIWRIDTNIAASYWGVWTNPANFTGTYFGNITTKTIYLSDSGTTDNGADITLDWRSGDIPLANEQSEYVLQNLYFKVQPQSSSVNLAISIRRDTKTYEAVRTLVIPADTTRTMTMYRISSTSNAEGRTLSFKFVVSNGFPFRMYEMFGDTNKQSSEIVLS